MWSLLPGGRRIQGHLTGNDIPWSWLQWSSGTGGRLIPVVTLTGLLVQCTQVLMLLVDSIRATVFGNSDLSTTIHAMVGRAPVLRPSDIILRELMVYIIIHAAAAEEMCFASYLYLYTVDSHTMLGIPSPRTACVSQITFQRLDVYMYMIVSTLTFLRHMVFATITLPYQILPSTYLSWPDPYQQVTCTMIAFLAVFRIYSYTMIMYSLTCPPPPPISLSLSLSLSPHAHRCSLTS